MAKKSPGGSGRGNKGVPVIDFPDRPDCEECGLPMKSDGERQWACDPCGKAVRKNKKGHQTARMADVRESAGFDVDRAENHAIKCSKGKRLLVTSAQNNTDVDIKFLKSLKQACNYFDCELAVIPSHYMDRYIFDRDGEKWFDPRIQDYLVSSEGGIEFGNILIRANVRVRPTTLWPLAGKQAHGGDHWIIFGHPQIACEPVATPGDNMPKKLFTTGSVTVPNYSVTDAGVKAAFHHCQGALILEKHRSGCFVRQLNADENGHFYDLDIRFTPSGYSKGHRVEAITPGDEHVKWNKVEKVIYGNGGIVDLLRPRYIVRNDVLDGYAGSHHHEKDPLLQFIKHHNGDNDYRAEVEQAIDFINRTTPKGTKTCIVPSNHHDHLMKYLNRAEANRDHQNALFILEMQRLIREAALSGQNTDPFYLYAKDRLTCDFEFLDRNQPYFIGDVDHSQHGDTGTNGSRGSARNLAKATYKMTIGHSHSARIVQGVYQVGDSTGKLDYESGLSDHSTTICVQYPNSKRTLIDIIDGRWHGGNNRVKAEKRS